jgi:hypothetical protein
MNLIFHDLFGLILEIYIDDIFVKLDEEGNHLADLRMALEIKHRYGMKMSPLKFAFGVSARNFLGFNIPEHGEGTDRTKIKAIQKVKPSHCNNDMHTLLGNINFLRRSYLVCLKGKSIHIGSQTNR